MSFDLEAKLRVDYSDLDRMQEEIEQRAEAVDSEAAVDVDTARAEDKLDDLQSRAEDLTDTLSRTQRVDLDTSAADRKLTTLTDDWRNRWEKAIDEISTNLSNMETGGAAKGAWMGGLMQPKTGVMLGAGLALGGFALAGTTTGSALEAAKARALMERSTKQIFGSAADQYEAEAERLAGATGYMTTAIQQAQLTLQKSRVTTGMADMKGNAGDIGPMVGRIADIAATSGLPQFADDVNAVAQAVASGLQGTSTALLDFGIRLDDAYVLSLGVNKGFKAMEDAITPAQMAQARYNAIMEQTNTINGQAADTQDDAARSLQKFHQSMEDAKSSVGEVLLPIAKGLADFVANIPDPLLKAGVWGAIFAGLAAGLGGLIIGFSALKRAMEDLGITATKTAAQVKLSEMTQGGGTGLPGKGGLPGTGGTTGWLDKLGKLAGKIGYSGGGLSAGAGYAGTGTLAAGVAGGAVLALPAVLGAGLLMKYGSNMEKNAQTDLDAATERYLKSSVLNAKRSGGEITIPIEAIPYAQQQGLQVEKVRPGATEVHIIIGDRTDNGISADEASWAESNY